MTPEEEAALVKKQQFDCGQSPVGHSMIKPNPAWPERCAKCGLSKADKEKMDAERAVPPFGYGGMFP